MVMKFSRTENKKPGARAGLVDAKANDARQLPGWRISFRSARARRHPGGHAGAGQDVVRGGSANHGADISTKILRDATNMLLMYTFTE
jgi:hypothetical protein